MDDVVLEQQRWNNISEIVETGEEVYVKKLQVKQYEYCTAGRERALKHYFLFGKYVE